MIKSFKDEGTEAIFNGRASKKARQTCPVQLWRIASRKLDHIDSAEQLEDLKVPPGNKLEKLSGDRRGQFSIRINEQYRVCFTWSEGGPSDVEIVDYHK
jgi:proteic killer suppression protein